jgi:hypothetical protein
LGGEAAMSKSISGIVVYALRTLVIWMLNEQRLVAQSTMLVEMMATVYYKLEID